MSLAHSSHNVDLKAQKFSVLSPFPVLFGTMLMDMIGFGLVVPLLPFYAEKFNGAGAEVGWLVAIFALGMLLASPLWGKLADTIGRRKSLITAIIGEIICYFLLPFAPSLFWLLVLRFFAGVMSGNMTIVQTYLSDITPPEERSKRMGTLGISFGLGFIIGPALGGLGGHFGIAFPMFLASAMLLINLIFVLLALPEPKKHVLGPSEEETWNKIFHSDLLKLFLAGTLTMLAFSGMQGTFALLTQKNFHFGPSEVGYSMTYIGVIIVLSRLVLGKFLEWLGEKKLMMLGILVIAVALFILPRVHDLITLYMVITLLPLGMSTFNPTFMALVSHDAPAKSRGFIMGTANTALGLGNVVGPILCGYIFDFNPILSFSIGAGSALLAVGVVSMYTEKYQRKTA